MKPGDLRRFKDRLGGSGSTERVSGQLFVVINAQLHSQHPPVLGSADFLIGGRIETGWSLSWVMNNSEVLSEAG
jgi:hypothetical protein